MLVVDNGDAIRGIAEVATKLDFTVNGFVGTVPTQLADGQMASSETDMYLSGANSIVVASITVTNTDSAARTFTLYLKPSAGTARAISPVSLDLGVGHCFLMDAQRIVVMDAFGHTLLAYDVPTLTTKGDVLTRSTALTRLGVGANDTVLTADSGEATGLKWGAVSGIPSGGIIIWHGTIANIPVGFVICDGNNSTPNLLTKFIQGVATAATDPGATGGAATHTLATSEMPAHVHYQVDTTAGANASGASSGAKALFPDTIPTSSTGGGGAHENEPTFYDVAFVMKT